MISVPPTPKARRFIRPEAMEENCSLNNRFQSSEKKTSRQRNTSNSSENKELFKNQSTSYEKQITKSSSEEEEEEDEDEEAQSLYQSSVSNSTSYRSISPKRDVDLKPENHTNSAKNTSSYYYFIVIIVIVLGFLSFSNENKVQTQSINNPTLLLSESIKNIKTTFHNQESDIWNDISSAINEVISRTPKTPSIILLFAKETTTMNCLATKLALMSSTILHSNSYLVFHPEDFGNDTGEIITILKEHPPEKKKVVVSIHIFPSINSI